MRKFLVLGLLAATAAVPSTAMAQDGDTEVSRQERREARQQRRQERQQARQQQRQQPTYQVQASPPSPPPPPARQDRRDARRDARQGGGQIPEGAWIGNPNDPRMEEHRRRYERIERQNARQHGTPQQLETVIDRQRAFRQDRREDRREDRAERREDRRDWRDDRRADRREDRQEWREDRREARQDRREWNREWRRDRRYDWRSYRNYNRYAFRAPTYYAPYRGYSYNRFSIGVILDRLFWDRNYWISDPYQYRLPYAPYGYVWVRYYDDVLLVDTYNGRVVDVIHDFFWR